MIKDKTKYSILLLFFIVTIFWGAGFSITKIALNHGAPEFFLLSARFILGSVILLALRGARKKSLAIPKQTIKAGSILGVLLFLAFVLQTFGISKTTPAKSGLLTDSFVVIVPLLLVAFNKRVSIKAIVDAVICFFGMMVFFNIFDDSSAFGAGEWLLILCAVALALHIIYTEKYANNFDTLDLTCVQIVVCAVLSTVFSLIFETPLYTQIQISYTIGSIIFLALFSTAIAFFIQTLAQKYFSSTVIALSACLEAVFAVVISVLLGLDTFSLMYLMGSAFIVFALLRSVLVEEHYQTFLSL